MGSNQIMYTHTIINDKYIETTQMGNGLHPRIQLKLPKKNRKRSVPYSDHLKQHINELKARSNICSIVEPRDPGLFKLNVCKSLSNASCFKDVAHRISHTKKPGNSSDPIQPIECSGTINLGEDKIEQTFDPNSTAIAEELADSAPGKRDEKRQAAVTKTKTICNLSARRKKILAPSLDRKLIGEVRNNFMV